MEEIRIENHLAEEEKYRLLSSQLKSLLTKNDNLISNLSNCSAAIKDVFDKVSWVGFYLYDGEKLYLGPFQGKVACTSIEMGKGVCGTSAAKRETIIVPDVEMFPGHIACDSGSKSEIVIPIMNSDNLFGVLDLDSYAFNSFGQTDKKYLEEICKFLSEEIFPSNNQYKKLKMSNFIVTARKWRPQRFEDVVGQEHITSTLKNAIKENRIAHAYLFTGPRGVGKTTTARILAKTLNCTNRKNSEPCNECEMCLSIQNSQLIDIIEIDGASNRGIDEIRTLRESVKYAPTHGKYKVYIIDEVHMLTKESFNAFLKTLEEPPEHVIFIFATTDVHKVPLTIISRCQRYDFRRIQLDKIKETLKMIADKEKIKIDDKTLTIIAKKADGALRDAESYFDQVVAFSQGKIDADLVTQMLNLIDEEIYFNLSDAVLDKDFKIVFQSSEKIYENGWDFGDFLEGLIEHFRNILSAAITSSTNTIETADIYKNRYLEYKGKFSESDLLRLLNFLNRSQQELRYSQNQKLKIEIILSHLIALESSQTISEIISEADSIDVGVDKFSEPKTGFYKPTEPIKKKVDKLIKTEQPKESKQIKSDNKLVSIPEDPIVGSNINFDEVVKKWKSFVESISQEKGLTLTPALIKFNLVSMNNNNLQFTSDNEEDINTFRINEKYLNKKSENFFGRRFNFILNKTQPNLPIKKISTQKLTEGHKTSTDPYEEIILNELDGEKIA